MSSTTTIRAFCAVELPVELQTAIDERLRPMREAYPDGRWVAARNLHLTVKFLGDMRVELQSRTERALTRITEGCQPFSARLQGSGTFGRPTDPRVIWLGLTEGSAELARLAADVEAALAPLGFAPESRPFRAHLTVARCRGGPLPERATDLLAEHAHTDWGNFDVRGLALMQSLLRRQGPMYTRLAFCPMHEPGIV